MLKLTSALLIFLSIHLSGISNEIISEVEKEAQEELFCAIQIIKQQPESIHSYDEGKLYLKSERIIAAINGLFLCNENSSIYLPSLHSSNQGCYINFQSNTNLWRNFYKCSECDYEYLGGFGETDTCPRCGGVAHKM